MSRLAALATSRPWRVIAVAIAFVLVALLVGGPLTKNLSATGFEDPAAEFVHARDTLQAATGASPAPGLIALVTPGVPVDSPAGRAKVAQVARTITADPDVNSAVTAFNGGGPDLVSADGRSTYIATFFGPIPDDQAQDAAKRLEDEFAKDSAVKLGGAAVVGHQAGTIIGEDLAKAEMLAFPILFLLSLWVFRGVVAALLPSVMGGVVILGGFLAIGLVNEATSLSIYALNLAIGLSLGLAIDYSLLIVSRYREELARHGPGEEALRATLRTSGRTVVFQTASTGYLSRDLRDAIHAALAEAGADGRPLAWVSARNADEREGEREDAWELELRVWPGPVRHVAHLDFHGNHLDWLDGALP